MKAREMFKELGYTYSEVGEFITFQLWLTETWCSSITFNKNRHFISVVDFVNNEDNEGNIINKTYNGTIIDVHILEAINQQVKELGWVE